MSYDEKPKVNKARLDSLLGRYVGHVFRSLNPHPVSALTPAPEVPALKC